MKLHKDRGSRASLPQLRPILENLENERTLERKKNCHSKGSDRRIGILRYVGMTGLIFAEVSIFQRPSLNFMPWLKATDGNL
jgi:hypothetical protein